VEQEEESGIFYLKEFIQRVRQTTTSGCSTSDVDGGRVSETLVPGRNIKTLPK